MKIRYKLNNKGIIAIPVFLGQNQNAELTDLYLVQLIEHPILRIPNILFVYFLSIFPDKSFELISKYTQKCQYNSLY